MNFNSLLQKNNDTVAWLKVEGTNVNYPVVQSTDNSYYLSHEYLVTIAQTLIILKEILSYMGTI